MFCGRRMVSLCSFEVCKGGGLILNAGLVNGGPIESFEQNVLDEASSVVFRWDCVVSFELDGIMADWSGDVGACIIPTKCQPE